MTSASASCTACARTPSRMPGSRGQSWDQLFAPVDTESAQEEKAQRKRRSDKLGKILSQSAFPPSPPPSQGTGHAAHATRRSSECARGLLYVRALAGAQLRAKALLAACVAGEKLFQKFAWFVCAAHHRDASSGNQRGAQLCAATWCARPSVVPRALRAGTPAGCATLLSSASKRKC